MSTQKFRAGAWTIEAVKSKKHRNAALRFRNTQGFAFTRPVDATNVEEATKVAKKVARRISNNGAFMVRRFDGEAGDVRIFVTASGAFEVRVKAGDADAFTALVTTNLKAAASEAERLAQAGPLPAEKMSLPGVVRVLTGNRSEVTLDTRSRHDGVDVRAKVLRHRPPVTVKTFASEKEAASLVSTLARQVASGNMLPLLAARFNG